MQCQTPVGGHSVNSSGAMEPAAPESHAVLKNHMLST